MTNSDPRKTRLGSTSPVGPPAPSGDRGETRKTPASDVDSEMQGLRDGIRVGDLIGAGGMGQVFRAWDGDEEVAIKFLAPGFHYDSSHSARFKREQKTLEQLFHPGIVRVRSVARDGSYFTMELINGPPLKDYVEQNAPLPTRLVAKIARQIALAVSYANSQGVIHRDLKPSNVLVVESKASEPAAKLIDFGIAVAEDATLLTATGHFVGSPHYVAPELVAAPNRNHGPSVDIYGIGGVLYFMLSGKTPFGDQSTNADELLELVKDSTRVPSPPRSKPDDREQLLNTICLRCLHHDPELRYQSAAAVADDLQAFLDGTPIEASPESKWRRSRRFFKRNARSTALVSLACTVALVMGFLWRDASQQQRKASRFAESLIAALEAQVEILDEPSVLKSPENRQLCDNVFAAYREIQSQFDPNDLTANNAATYGEQLLRIASIANALGSPHTAQEFVAYFTRLGQADSVHPSDAKWQFLTSKSQVVSSEALHLQDSWAQAVATTQTAEKQLKKLEAARPQSIDLLNLKADLFHLRSTSQFLQVRRGPGLTAAYRSSMAEVVLREQIYAEAPSDETLLACCRALSHLGFVLYRGGETITKPYLEARGLPGDSIASDVVLRKALERLVHLETPDSPSAIVVRGDIRNTLGMALVRMNPMESERLHRSNIRDFTDLTAHFPLVYDYQVRLARAYGNLADYLLVQEGSEAESLAPRREAYQLYCNMIEDFGTQSDTLCDLSVNGIRLYTSCRYKYGTVEEADQIREVLFRHLDNPSSLSRDLDEVQLRFAGFYADAIVDEYSLPAATKEETNAMLRGQLASCLDIVADRNVLTETQWLMRREVNVGKYQNLVRLERPKLEDALRTCGATEEEIDLIFSPPHRREISTEANRVLTSSEQ
ncbi:MAG: serine/threonine-protein kinase [Aureliella sp.]